LRKFFCGLCDQELVKAFNRKERQGIAKDAKKTNCTPRSFIEPIRYREM